VCVQPHTAAVNATLFASAAERRAADGRPRRLLQARRAAIDRYRLDEWRRGAQQQTRRTLLQR